MSSFKDLVKKANAGKQTTKKKEEDKNHSSFVDLVKKTNANIKSNLTEDEVAKWSNSVGEIGKRASNYLSTDGYKKADTALAEEINKHIEDSHSISQYLRANKSRFKNYDEIYNGYIEQVNYLKDLQKSITDSNEYFSKFKTEKEYEDHKIGWLNPEAETNAETASARQERYRQNEARLKQMEEDLPWYAATIMPDFMENWFLSDEDENKKVEYETLKAENNRYKRTQSVLDEYYTPETPEFLANGAERNYTNASKEDLQKHNASQTYIESLLSDGNHYYDSNANIVNATTKKIDYVADDLTRAMYAEATGSPISGGFFDTDKSDNATEQYYNSLVQDKLGMFLSASDDDLATAYSELASAPTDVNNTWARVLQEGDQNAWKYLEEHELNIYYNLYKTQGQAAAYEYLDKMTTELTRRETVARQKEIDEASWLEQLWLNAKSVPQNVFGGALSFVEDAANMVRGEDINPYSRAHSFQNDAQYVRQVTAQEIDEATGGMAIPWLDFSFGDAYQALMSAADSTVGAMMGGSTYGTLMGMGAASSTMKDLWEKGADAGQMFAGGILSGAAEMIFEKYSIDKLVKIGDSKTIGQFIINGLKQGGVEASEEMLTEIANTITNSIVMGSQSDWVDAETFAKNVVNAGLSGFMSGGAMGGTVSAINYNINKSQFKQAGADIIEQGATEELLNLANEMAGVTGDKTLFKYSDKAAVANQNKAGSKKAALEVGRTSALLQDNITEQNQGDIQDALIEKGLDKKDAKRVSEYLASTKELTEEQIAEVKGNENIKAVAKELLGDPESKINERQKKYIAAKLGVKYETNVSNITTKSGDIAVNSEVDVKDKVSADGKTVQVSTGEAITINKDNAIAKIKTVDGERVVYLNTDKGVVASNDVNYASESEALVYESFVDLNPAFANAVIKNYDNNVPMQTYIKGMREGIVLYGMHNFQGVGKDISKNTYFAELSAEDQAFALKLGSAYADMVAKKQGKTLRTAIKNAAEKAEVNKNTSTKATSKKGRVSFEGGVVAKGKLQKRTVSLAKHLASAIGIDIVFYDARTTTDENSKGANGYFDEDTNTIHLDLQNSASDAKTIAFTLSHELVHFIKKWSPEKFNTFSKFLMENYAKHGVNTSQLLANKMADLGTKDADLAYEEMIADACETMLLDSNAVYKLMELRKADLELFEKIKLHIHELLNKLRNMYKELGLQPSSDEAKALLGMTDVLEQMYSLFEEASVDAAQNYQAVQNANEIIFGEESVDVGKTESGVKNQLKNHKKIGEDATAYNDRHKNVHKAILQVGIESMYEMAEVMLPYLEEEGILPPDIPGKTIFKNGSYGRTGENTTLCVRTLTYEDFKDRVAENLGRPLTVSESLLVSQKIYDIATEPQCIYCYVAADRKAYDGYLGEYWKAMDKYIKAMRNGGDSKALYTEYLAGRKDTNQQQKRWSQWETIAKSGKDYISAKDLTTKRKRDALIAKKNAFSEQIKDAQRYAQSASWAKTVFDYRAYKGDILKMSSKFVDMLNSEYGLRMYSFSDYTPAFIVENMQMLIDASVKGLKSLAYTKDTDYAEIFASTGQAINVSCFARWDAESGTYVEDNRQGANWEKTKSLRKQYRNVGAVMVATNDAMVEWALKQDWVDVVIPYHIVKTGTTIANEYQWNNYTSESADRVGNKTANIYPTEHNNDFATYSNLLNERGITPRFSRWYDKVASGELTEAQYMKLVNEVRLPASELSAVTPNFNLEAAKNSFGVDNEGNVIKGGFVDKGGYMGGWYRQGVDVNQEVMAVSEDIKAGKSSLDVDYGMSKAAKEKVEEKYKPSVKKQVKKDSLGNKLSEGQIEYFKDSKVRDEKGRLIPVYHGSKSAGFTEFTKSDEIGYFFARTIKTSRTYAGGSKAIYAPDKNSPEFSGAANYKVYLDIKKPYIIDGNGANWNQLEANGERVDISIKSQKWNNGSGIAKIQFKYNGKTYSQTVRTSEEFENFISKHTNPEMAKAFAYAMGQAVDKNGKGEFNAGFIWDFKNSVQGDTKNTRDIVRKAYNSHWNYDGVIFKNVVDSGDGSKIKADDLYVVFNSNQIKSVNNTEPTKSEDIRYQKKRDKDYLKAVESGDMETAQRMVDEAAEKAGYTINAYHGTPDSRNLVYNKITGSIDVKGDFSIFDSSKSRADRVDGSAFFFTNNEKVAKFYSPEQGYKPKVYNSKLKIVNPLFVECNGANWNEIPFDKLAYSYPTPNGGVKTTNKVTTKDIAQYARENGYDGVVFENIIDGKADTSENIGTVYAVFSSNQIKSADPVTYDDKGNVIPLSERFNKDNNDIRYQKKKDSSSYAPIFYSQMGKVVEGIKMEKIGAASVVNFLKGKGIKHDEIKWSGIETFLEGKKSVTKQELLDFINASSLEIGEQIGTENAINDVRDAINSLYYTVEREFPYCLDFSSTSEFIEGIAYELERDRRDLTSVYDEIEAYILDAMFTHFEPTDEYSEFYEWQDSEDGQKIYAAIDDTVNTIGVYAGVIQNTSGSRQSRWQDYTLDGGENYRELVFTMPGSTYSNQAMKAHWGQDAEGVLAHARIQDFNVDGKKMLFIEEIQSDWHNEGNKNGYESNRDAMQKKIADLDKQWYSLYYKMLELKKGQEQTDIIKKMDAIDEEKESLKRKVNYGTFVPDAPFKDNYHEYVLKRLLRMAAEEGYDSIGWTTADIQSERWSDEFAEGYRIEYDQDIPKFLKKYGKQWGATVEKTFLGDATQEKVSYVINNEEGNNGQYYSTIEEAVEVLVEQSNEWWGTEFSADSVDIDEWDDVVRVFDEETGAEIGTLHTEYGNPDSRGVTEVWSMDITDSMEQAVLYEGQAKFQKKKVSNRTILSNALESAIDTSTQAGQNELKLLKQYQDKIDTIEKEEAHLAEVNAQIKEISFGKNTDRSKLKDLNEDKVRTNNRINIYDKQLMRLEAMKPIKDILAREKEMVRKRTEEKGREALAEYRKEAIKVRNQMIGEARKETRQKISESRSKTEMRHKIKKVVGDLRKLLNRGTKERNVKLELQDAVGKALTTAEVLFSNEITNADIVRLGVESVTPTEEKALNKYAELLDKLAKTNDGAEIKRIKGQISGYDARYKDLFVRERARLNKGKVSDALTSLANAYADLKNSTDDYVKNNAYVEGMHEKIVNLSNDLQGVTIRDMSYWELKMVYDMYAMVKHMVQQANSIFREGKYEDLMTNISNVQMELDEISTSTKDPTEIKEKIADFLRGFTWNELKPYAAFERLGSQTFQKLFWDVVEADNVWARDIEEARQVIESARKKHGFKKWDTQKAVTIKSANGLDFKLTLEDMMSIYAYSKRPQAEDHMTVGGFVFDVASTYKDKKGKFTRTYKHKKLSETYRVDHEVIKSVMKELAKVPGAMQYVDEVQGYLTKLGEKGNEVSRVMYGIDLFKEEVYFPLQSAADYRSSVEQTLNATQTTASLKNIGMSKETVPKASNPIVLKSFDNVVLDHINQMAKYHAYVVPIENLSKVFNNVNKGSGEYISTQALISSKFGESAKRYFNQFITDLNGGSLNGGASNPLANMFATSKAVSVGANLSVVVQQYFAVIRALDEMNPKYFVPFLNGEASKSNEKQYEELKKYAPVGIIKQIGGFDMGANRSALDYIGDTETRLDGKKVRRKVKDAAMWLPGKMDEVGWSTIWRAVKKEIADTTNYKVGTKEFFEACGKRFTEIVAKTQVYDSVTSRSGYMRSKHETVKYLTSFMGEPTAIVNKMFTRQLELHRAIKSKDKSRIKAASAGIARTSTVLILSTVLTSLAKSLPYAMRDDDEEDKALLERWAKHFGEATFSDMNPLNMLPVGRDLVSIWEGWDVERPDTTLISDIFTTFKKAMDDGCTAEEAMDFAGSLSNILGYPLKNVIRDVRGIVRLVGDIADDITPTDIGGSFGEGFIGEDKSKDDRLYDAVVNGDTARIEVLKSNYDTDSKYNTALAKAIVANDSEIVGVASDYLNEEFSSYDSKIDELIALGFTPDSAVKAIKKVVGLVEAAAQAEADGDTETYDEKVQELLDLGYDESQLMADIEYLDAEPSDDTEKAKSRWEKDDYVAAVTNGDTTMAEIIKADLIETDIQNGKTEEEAEKSLNNALNRGYKEDFFNGDMSESEVEDWIRELYPDKTDSDVYWVLKEWKKEKEHQDDPDYSYSKYGEYYEAILNGDTRTMNAFKFEMQQHNNYDKNVNKQVASAMQSAITSHFKPIYKAASPYERASLKAKILAAYTSLGYAYGKMSVKIDKWLTED